MGRVAVLKKRIDAVESGLEAADAAEEDLKKVETSLNSATIIQPPEVYTNSSYHLVMSVLTNFCLETLLFSAQECSLQEEKDCSSSG